MQNRDTAFPWLRRMKVTFSGLGDNQATRIYESDGTPNTLRISAHIEKSIKNRGAVSSLAMYNLSSDTRGSFVRGQTKAVIEAGWENGQNAGRSIVFMGNFLISHTQRQGPDLVTTVYLQPARGILTITPVIASWGAGAPIEQVLRDIVRTLDDVAIDKGSLVGINRRVGTGGLSVSGDAETVIDQLARQCGFDWSVNDNRFQAVAKDKSVSRGGTIQTPELLQVSPVLVGVRRYRRGVSGTCLFRPSLAPGQDVTVKSAVDSASSGDFRIQEVTHSLDCYAPGSFITSFGGVTREDPK